jgi:hypothetical protein
VTPLTEIAWAAGFFDGEGNTRANRHNWGRKRLRLFMRVTNTNLAQLQRFQVALEGLGRIYKVKGRAEHKQSWIWQGERKTAELALETLWPYLGEEKRAQAERAMEQIRDQPRPAVARRSASQAEQLPGIGA